MKIVVGHSDRATRFALQRHLGEGRHQVELLSSGEGVLSRIPDHPPLPEVIFLEWNRPVIQGLGSLVRAREGGAIPYLILVVAQRLPGDPDQVLAKGADDFLLTPVYAEDLAARLAVARHRLRTQASAASGPTVSERAAKALELLEGFDDRRHGVLNPAQQEWLAQVREVLEGELEPEVKHDASEPTPPPEPAVSDPEPPPNDPQSKTTHQIMGPNLAQLIGRDAALLEDFLETMLDELPRYIAELTLAIQSWDPAQIGYLAQDIMGITVQGSQLRELAERLETAAKSNQPNRCHALTLELGEALDDLRQLVRERDWWQVAWGETVLDRQLFEAAEEADTGRIAELAQDVLAETQPHVEGLRTAIEEQRAGAIRNHARELRSVAIGADQLQRIAQDIQRASQEGNLERCQRWLPYLLDAFTRFEEVLNRTYHGNTSG
jgi:CheY-like chemotaxis protein